MENAIDGFFQRIVETSLNPLLELLSQTLLTTPEPGQIPEIGALEPVMADRHQRLRPGRDGGGGAGDDARDPADPVVDPRTRAPASWSGSPQGH
ncbi:hypothetical protein [Nocardia sp. bgisy134]|uniref:hypothetical protein n=1 Tax=Nocardia sp. bgisy134 TaxID=3413789 RepID=UPI003D72951F